MSARFKLNWIFRSFRVSCPRQNSLEKLSGCDRVRSRDILRHSPSNDILVQLNPGAYSLLLIWLFYDLVWGWRLNPLALDPTALAMH